jgi:hypothetical protein
MANISKTNLLPDLKPNSKRPGRPRLQKGEAKGLIVPVRFSPEERKRVHAAAKASKQNVSQWIRGTLAAAIEGNLVSYSAVSKMNADPIDPIVRCPSCDSADVRPSRRLGTMREAVQLIGLKRPVRCHECFKRFYCWRWEKDRGPNVEAAQKL